MRSFPASRLTARAAGAAPAALLLLLLTPLAQAGDFRVSPIRVDLAGGAKGGGVVNVINEGADPISFQIRAMEWNQDAAGKDVYTETADLVFFPQLLTTAGYEKKVIRVGTKAPAPTQERSYRLFIEEIPRRDDAGGAAVRIAVRFGVPVFLLPAVARKAGVLEEARVERGTLVTQIRNTGNVHLQVLELESVGKDEAGAEVFREKPAGWYVLVGAAREQRVAIPAEVCGRIRTLSVTVRDEELTLTRELSAGEGWCP